MAELEAFYGALEREGDYDGLAFGKCDFTGQDAEGAHFVECALVECTLDAVRLSHARILETIFTGARATKLELPNASLQNVAFTDCRIGALVAHASQWTNVIVRGGKLDYVNLRDARLDTVRLEGCIIGDLDLAGAIVTRLVTDRCRVGQLTLSRAKLKETDLRGAELSSITGLMELAGATISNGQLHGLAPSFAAHLGISIA